MSNFLKPKIQTASAAPVPAPAQKAKTLAIEPTTNRTAASQKRKGRSGLRIDLQAGNAGADGTGVNVPRV